MLVYSDGWFRTMIVGWQRTCIVCTTYTVAVVLAVAVVVTVAVAVAVAAAVAGGKCPSAPATTSARAPGPAPSSTSCGTHTPLPTHSPKDPISPTCMAVYGNGPHVAPCPGRCAEQIERPLLHQATETWPGRDSYMASNDLICPWGAMLRGRTPFCLVPDPLRPADSRVLESAATVKGTNRRNMDGEK